MSLFNIVFSCTEEKRLKQSYFAVFTSISGIFGFVSAVMGGFIAQALAGIKVQIMGFTLINYHFLFILASTIRFLSLVFLVRVREKEAYPTIRALQLMGDYTTRRLALYKDLILNTMRFQR